MALEFCILWSSDQRTSGENETVPIYRVPSRLEVISVSKHLPRDRLISADIARVV